MNLKNIFLLGDIGFFNYNLNLVCNSIYNTIKPEDIIIILGDNFYPYGIINENDTQIDEFSNIFNKFQNPIYSILGNHDYLLNPVSQIKNENWIMDDFYYKKEYENCELYFLDTVQFNIHTWVSNEKIEYTHNDTVKNLINNQINWLETEMSKDITKPKIVFGHYPILTNGVYYNKMNNLYKKLINIFKKYNVLTYISGHEHNIQFIKRKKKNYILNQIIIGSSAENRNEPDMSKKRDMFDNSEIFYGKLKIDSNTIIEFINKYGNIKYSYILESKDSKNNKVDDEL